MAANPTSPAVSPRLGGSDLGGSDVGRCLTWLHHDRFTPTSVRIDPVVDRMRGRGLAHEDHIVATVVAAHHDAVVLPTALPPDERTAATIAAMDAGAPVIVGGRLEDDASGYVGRPDILVRLGDGYAPVEVKGHRVIATTGIEGSASELTSLAERSDDPVALRSGRRRDALQATHYWLLLDAVGHAASAGIVGVVGTDEPARCIWLDVGDGDPSLLDAHAAWVAEARDVLEHGMRHPGRPLVRAWRRSECDTCDFRDVCIGELVAAGDPTLLRGIDATMRAELAGDGILTIEDVADLEPDDPRIPDGAVVLQARASVRGGLLRTERSDHPVDLPEPDVEIDLDLETHDGIIYLAGVMTTVDGESTYDPIADWTGTPEGERVIVGTLFDRLAAIGDGALTYHWTEYESRVLADAAVRHDLAIPGSASVEAWFADHAFDLCAWSRRTLVSPAGHSLKVIAPLCGFSWRDDDPGGLQSELWFEQLLTGDTSMRDRLLAYNEDDVRAQLAVRRWVRRHDAGRGPGTAIPSVLEWPPS
jgi:predicted RecB family nuclease